MSRFLSNNEIEFWKEKIKESSYSNSFMTDRFHNLSGSTKINYRFSFSIAKTHELRFENLFTNFVEEGFSLSGPKQMCNTKLQTNLQNEVMSLRKQEKKRPHKIASIEYINYHYEFKLVPIYSCVFFVQTIKDIIEIISNYYSIDEEGNEICTMNYSTGEIVSLSWDKEDYIIDSVLFLRRNTHYFEKYKNQFEIKDELLLYRLSKITSFNKQVIEYGNQELASSSQIRPSRGRRLDELLG